MASWFGQFDQISVATDDLDRTIGFWERQVGVGPWTVFRGLNLSMRYETRAITLPCNVAVAWHDGRLLELIQVGGDGPSPFHDALNRPIIGLQRLAFATDDIDRDARNAESRGMERFADGEVAGQRFVYFRSSEAPGVILELLERTPMFDRLVECLKARAQRFTPSLPTGSPATGETGGEMTVVELIGYGGPDQFRVATAPKAAPGSGELRIRVAGAAVNPVDLKARSGLLHDFVPLAFPAQLGGDVSGVVEAVGDNVAQFAIGDRVAGMINPFANGGYASHIIAPESAFAKVPDTIDLAAAAAAPTGVLTGTQLVEIGIRPRAGDRILVTGAGGSTGRAAVMAALDAGATVFAGVRPDSRAAIADLAVTATIDLADEAALASAGPFDAVADTVGGDIARRLFAHLKPDGILASIAVPPPEPPAHSTQRFCSFTVAFDRMRLEQFFREWAVGNRRIPIAHRLPLSKVADAHRLMECGGVGGKIVLIP
ncbi:alcohol dehydrogenase catalytic domain-containing protein [Sphingopyxis sp.]|uniref:alcohol dehydrogenase catalytic domain-containing protein n=1 Tax=Sphingopyxis sp. TaxID=1908224 RepID=UPI003D6C9720